MVARGLFGPDSLWVQDWQQAMAEMMLAIGGCRKDESDDLTLPALLGQLGHTLGWQLQSCAVWPTLSPVGQFS
jgi:hypothetical protein